MTVNINSPGGYFESLGIYNLLRQHAGEVTVHVLSMAASAASVIAMTGDRMRAGGNLIRDEARRRAPKASGAMARQIVTRRVNAKNQRKAGVGDGGGTTPSA